MHGGATNLEARFLNDVTVSDGTVVLPRTNLVKAWKIQNDGNVAWPQGCYMTMQDGVPVFGTSAVTDKIALPALQVGEEYVAQVEICAPQVPGRYTTYWRLRDPSGTCFGQRLWADIVVVDAATTASVDAASNDVESDSATTIDNNQDDDEDDEDDSAIPPLELVEEEEEIEDPLAEALAMLVSMGFEDQVKNRRVLEAVKGDVNAAVNSLVMA